MRNTPESRFALRAVYQAANLVRSIQQEMVSPALTKDDRSPVTVGDFAAQAFVARELSQLFPDQPLIGEESADALQTEENATHRQRVTDFVRRLIPEATPESVCDWIALGESEAEGTYWTLDPIDGTKGFLRGDQYAVALGQIANDQVQLGVLGCPSLGADGKPAGDRPGTLMIAVRGQGTWSAPLVPEIIDDFELETPKLFERVNVSEISSPTDARLLRSAEAAHTNTGGIGLLLTALGSEADSIPMDSQAKYAMLASGKADLLVRMLSPKQPDYREKVWDQAAGSIVVEEAGGRVSDLHGRPLDFGHGRTLAENSGVLATNGHLHDAVLAALDEMRRTR